MNGRVPYFSARGGDHHFHMGGFGQPIHISTLEIEHELAQRSGEFLTGNAPDADAGGDHFGDLSLIHI